MKKYILLIATIATLSLISCTNQDYKAKGELMARSRIRQLS